MKKIVFFLLTIVLLGACAEDVVYQKTAVSNNNNQMFSYDSVTNPEVWKTFMSFEEMMEATQIPEELLKEIPTDTLVALCMNHPLANNYIYYNNHLKGAKIIIDNFNGFQELKKRDDASQKILDFYESYDMTYNKYNRDHNPFASYRTIIKPLNIGFVELVIASKEFVDLYSDKYVSRLENVTNVKYEQKLVDKNYTITPIISKSLLISSQIKLERLKDLDNSNTKKLNHFLKVGGRTRDIEEIREISRIIYSK